MTVKKKKLTVKQQKFVKAIVEGKPKSHAYRDAGYKAATDQVARTEGSKLSTKPNIQAAIDDALAFHEATPEFAVKRLKDIASQNEEIGAARLASKDLLELHGWRKNERPTVSLTVNQAFFSKGRPIREQRSVEAVEDQQSL